MSATNRGSERIPHDFYETPAWCTELLLRSGVLPYHATHVLDAGHGTGAIGRVLHRAGLEVEGVEISLDRILQTPCPYIVEDVDFLTYRCAFDAVVSNPPYSLALEFVQHARILAPVVTMLLRLNFLASGGRAHYLNGNKPEVLVLANRPSFTGDGKTDACEYAWFCWGTKNPGTWRILQKDP